MILGPDLDMVGDTSLIPPVKLVISIFIHFHIGLCNNRVALNPWVI